MKSVQIKTGVVRLSFAHVFEPVEDDRGNLKYSASLLIPKGDTATVAKFKNAIKDMLADAEVVQKLGGKTKGIHLPINDGDEKYESNPKMYASYKDHYYVNAKANEDYPPALFDNHRNEIVDKTLMYSGCYVQAIVNLFPYHNKGNTGIGVGLRGLMKVRDGEALGGTGVSANDFDDFGDSDDDIF